MAQNQENPPTNRANVSLTGTHAKRLRKLQAILQVKHDPVTITLADVVIIAIAKLETELDTAS